MANGSRLCLICGTVLGSDAERREHIDHDHAGTRVEWRDKRPWVVTGDQATPIGPSALKRMRGNARKVTGGKSAVRGRTVLRRPDAPRPEPVPEPTAVMVETPLPDDPDAPPYFAQVQLPHFAIGGAPVGPTPTDGSAPSPEPIVSRETIRLALDQPTLAAMIRNLSIVISDWDGAGVQGNLSAIEAGQLAMLLHEPAITAVQRYFGGNVDRFRLALAAGILLLGKGRVHIRAIAARRRGAEANAGAEDMAAAYAATVPAAAVEVPIAEPADPDPLAELARRQREWNTTPRPDAAA